MEILSHITDGILTLNFNRPEKKNAITFGMYQALADAINGANDDKQVKVILITGKPEIFTAGNDLEDFMKHAGSLASSEMPPVYQFMHALNNASKPVIAAVAGAAVGIGTTMLMHCDLIYAAENAKFSLPFAQLGLCPEFASSMVFQQIVGYQRAAEKLLLGEAFLAQEALTMGFVNRVLSVEELLPYAQQQAAKIAALPAKSIRLTKSLMKASQPQAIVAKMNEENTHFASMLNEPAAREAMMAFFQKRKPDFTQFD
ncbi:MAG: enoyl-CoA hydratase [Undibacterium sp.]|nr:enoyl-CoA hydratase [Undibacterium sp.]